MSRIGIGLLRRARQQQHDALMRLPNVIGTALGAKRRGDLKVTRWALVVLVDRKVPPEFLARDENLPTSIICEGLRIPVDVVEVAGIRSEFGPPPYFVNDRVTKGVVTAFAVEGGGTYAVSCAHCMRGADGNPHTASTIWVWDSVQGGLVAAGTSVYAVDAPGFGVPGRFGFIDAALAKLDHPELIARARKAPPLDLHRSPAKDMIVYGQGPNNQLKGEVDALELIVENLRVDVMIRVHNSGTEPGHSGMLWKTPSGQAVAMHGYGAMIGDDGKSVYSLATKMTRVAQALPVALFDAG